MRWCCTVFKTGAIQKTIHQLLRIKPIFLVSREYVTVNLPVEVNMKERAKVLK